MLLSYKIEYANQNEIKVMVLNHNRPSLDTSKVVDSFYIWYVYDAENNCWKQNDASLIFKFYCSDKEFVYTINREVNLFAKSNPYKK